MKPWIQTYTGVAFEFPGGPGMFNLVDIAYALGGQPRYNAHGKFFYSVAAHSVIGTQWLIDNGYPKWAARSFLFHDAHEAYTGDFPGPAKVLVPGLNAFEDAVQTEIENWLGFSTRLAIVKTVDKRLRADEMPVLFKCPAAPWILPEPLGIELPEWGQKQGMVMFLKMCKLLEVNP